MSVHGILNVRKPERTTSMEVVRQVKRLTRERHVGHGGTLDPLATGVLPVCFGQATRLMEYLVESTKVYRAELLLGVTTDTYDATGAVVERRDPSFLSRSMVEEALATFSGTIYQKPPMYSALKRGGERLYNLARAGVTVDLAPRRVQVHRLDLLEFRLPSLVLQVECGRGLYIRALAHELGQALGCGSHLTALERLRSGPFTAQESVNLEGLENAVKSGTWQDLLSPPDILLLHLRAAVVGKEMERQIRNGRLVALGRRGASGPPLLHREQCRVYSANGRFLAVAHYEAVKRLWQPDKVFDLS
jgi:tRNA pseudouridine55 synthase